MSEKAGRGRPVEDLYVKYIEGNEEQIASACRDGADNAGLAKLLGCGKTTLSKLIKNYPQLKELIKVTKKVADDRVVSALYKSALGYEVEETTTEVALNKDGTGTTTMVKKTKKHIASDTTAAIYWLKNRRPEEWTDRQKIDLTVNPFEELMKAATSGEAKEDDQ